MSEQTEERPFQGYSFQTLLLGMTLTMFVALAVGIWAGWIVGQSNMRAEDRLRCVPATVTSQMKDLTVYQLGELQKRLTVEITNRLGEK